MRIEPRPEVLERFRFPGTYALLIYLPAQKTLKVGRLAPHRFICGWYLYVGSAQGPGGVAGRLSHHLGCHKTPRWHLDYLRPWTRPWAVWAAPCAREHGWAELLGDLPEAQFPVAGFGASDCRCSAHLVYLSRRPAPALVDRQLARAFPRDPRPKMIMLS
jgi:Uri superfamily endonuclease